MVLRPWRNADDLTGRPSDTWIIDFPAKTVESSAALFEAPFEMLKAAWQSENDRRRRQEEEPLRQGEPKSKNTWWLLQRARPKLRKAISGLGRYIATPRVGKFRTFVWLHAGILPDTRVVAIARNDDTTFGILHSRHHELWSLRYGARHGVGNDPEYVHTQTFETFPFPDGLTPNIPAAEYSDNECAQAIAAAAARLNELRENWLNPPDLVQRLSEVVSGYPDRVVPIDNTAAAILRRRTLTNLYNERPAWLDAAHRDLDAAVSAAYGWRVDLSDEQILESLFALNQVRAGASMVRDG